jgi:hypothetical protein
MSSGRSDSSAAGRRLSINETTTCIARLGRSARVCGGSWTPRNPSNGADDGNRTRAVCLGSRSYQVVVHGGSLGLTTPVISWIVNVSEPWCARICGH